MKLIVFESTGDWAAELTRRLPPAVSLVETRTLDDVWSELDGTPAIVALEFTPPRAETLLAALIRLDREFPQAVSVVLANASHAGWEPICREAGAVQFIASRRNVDQLIKLVRHQLAVSPCELVSAPVENTSLEEQILAGLPWAS
jgi:hypothetical protein